MTGQRFERPRRADTETPEPTPPIPTPLPRHEPLTAEERRVGIEGLNRVRAFFGKPPVELPGQKELDL